MPLGRAQQLCKLIKYVAVEHRQQQLQRRYERGRERYVFPDLSSSWAQYAGMEMRTLAGGKLARGMRWMPSAPAGHARASYEGPAGLPACHIDATQPHFCNHGERQRRLCHHRRPKGGGLHPDGLPVLRCVHLCLSLFICLNIL